MRISQPRRVHRTRLTSRTAVLAVAALSAAASQIAHGASATWIQTSGGPFNWKDNNNWSAAFPSAGADVATVESNLTTNVTISTTAGTPAALTLGGMSIGDTTDNGSGYNNFTITGGGSLFINPGAVVTNKHGSNTISTTLLFNQSGTVTVDAGSNLNIGLLTTSAAVLKTINLNGGGTGSVAAFTNGGGLVSVSVGGSSTWSFTGGNTYNNQTNIGGTSTLLISADNALGAHVATMLGTSVASGATLGIQGSINYATAEPLRISGTGSSGRAGAFDNVSGANTYAGPVTPASGTTGTIGVTAGSLTLTGGIFSQAGAVASGSVVNFDKGTINVTTTGIGSNSGVTSNLAVSKTTSGTTTISTANTYLGNTTVSGGSLVLGPSGNLGFGGSVGLSNATAGGVVGGGVGSTTVSTGGTVDFNGATVNEPIVLNGGNLINSNTSTAAKVNDGLAGIALTSAGSGYSTAPTINITGGGGTGASATATLGLTTSSYTSVLGGSLYTVGDILTLTGPGGQLGQVRVTAVNNASLGSITASVFASAGSDYSGAPTGIANAIVTNNSANSAVLNGANGTSFQVSGITLTNAGSGYTSAPSVSVVGGNAVAATAVLSSITLSSTSSIGGDGDFSIPAVISGPGGLNKIGNGTLTLTGANSFGGGITVSAGKLLANGSAAGTGGVSVAAGTLGGSGAISGGVTVQSSAALAPGNSPGSLEFGSTLKLQSNSTLQIELGGTNFVLNTTENYDRVKVSGLTTLAGLLNVSLINSFSIGANQTFGIVDAVGGLSGTFSNYAEGATVLSSGFLALKITYLGNVTDSTVSQTGGNDVVLFTVATPEPAAVASLVLVAGGALMRRRSRRVRMDTNHRRET